MDRKDGSYIIRYKIYETCSDFSISVKLDNNHVGSSPYISKTPVYAEDCNCPEKSFERWSANFQCNETYKQMDNDLKVFKNVDFNVLRPKILALYDKPTTYSICNYVILKNQVFEAYYYVRNTHQFFIFFLQIYRKCYGKYVGFKMFMDSILLSLARKVSLPDTEFFVNLGDWPLASKNNEPLPIFSWCGSQDTYDIVMPTYDTTESTLENMGR